MERLTKAGGPFPNIIGVVPHIEGLAAYDRLRKGKDLFNLI
jgi:hypothetical protein